MAPSSTFPGASRLGLLAWQDMPWTRTGSHRPPADAQQQFETELHELVERKKNWTSVIGWVPFNEGWGERSREATGRIAEDVRRQDPTRLVNAHSGVNCPAAPYVIDPGPPAVLRPPRVPWQQGLE